MQLFIVNCCGLRIPSHALRHCSKLMVATQSQSVNPSVGSGDGDAATNSFKDGVIHAVWVEVLAFRKAGGMVMFNEKADAKGVMKAVYNNPLRRHVAQRGHGVPVPRTGCPPRSSYPRHAGPV